MVLACFFSVSLVIPMAAKVEILIIAKDTPILKNKTLKYQNAPIKGRIKVDTVTMPKPINMDRFKPIRGRNEANKNEAIAIGISLKPSRILASALEISKCLCTWRITVPTEFNNMAKTK